MATEEKELTIRDLRYSCDTNGITSLYCEQGFDDTMEDVIADNPDMELSSLKFAVMVRMLDENLDYGPLEETDDELDSDDHPDRMSARCDICDEIATNWVNGKYGVERGAFDKAMAESRKLAEERAMA